MLSGYYQSFLHKPGKMGITLVRRMRELLFKNDRTGLGSQRPLLCFQR